MATLESAITQLDSAGRTLQQRWEHTKTLWNDPVSRSFEQNYLDQIAAQSQATLKAMQQLSQVIAAARRAVR